MTMKMFHLFMFSNFVLKISVLFLFFICELMRNLFYTEHAEKNKNNNK